MSPLCSHVIHTITCDATPWHTCQCSEICCLHPPFFLLWSWKMGVSLKKLTSPQPRKFSCEYVNTQATRTEDLTWLLFWGAKYFSITVHVWCKHASPIGLTVQFTKPSDPWVLGIKGMEWEADWSPLTIPLFPHIFMAWYFNQLLNYWSCSKVHIPFPHNITHLWRYYFL
jgi:hypothetical protein